MQVIGDEPGNTREDPDLPEEAVRKAKAEPSFRFHLLYDKIYRADILGTPIALAKANGGRRAWTG